MLEQMAGKIGRATVPVKCRGFKSCWRGLWERRFRGFQREGRGNTPSFPSSFSFPTDFHSSLSPSALAPMLARLGTNRKQLDFRAGGRDKGKLGENAALDVDKARAEREIYTHRLLTNSSGPDALLPIENPPPWLFDYRHTSCKHRNFLDFRRFERVSSFSYLPF